MMMNTTEMIEKLAVEYVVEKSPFFTSQRSAARVVGEVGTFMYFSGVDRVSSKCCIGLPKIIKIG